MRSITVTAILTLFAISGFAQARTVVVKGVVTDASGAVIPYATIINKNLQQGVSSDSRGIFFISSKPGDTLRISSVGYDLAKIAVPDLSADTIPLKVELRPKAYQLQPVEVLSERSVEEIKKDVSEIKAPEYKLQGVADLQSPISYLYERFSKMERRKRQVQELRNRDALRDATKELLAIYVKSDIIDLEEKDFERFIDYLNLSPDFIAFSSEYDLVLAIKEKYSRFSRDEDYRR